MKIALVQLNYQIGDFAGNAAKIETAIGRAKAGGARLALFSELAVTGYYPGDLLEKKEFIEEAEETVRALAGHCRGIAALVGAPAINRGERGKQLYNAAWFLEEGRVKDIFFKTLLPTYDVFDEYRHFEPNPLFRILELEGTRLAVTLCEDLWEEQPGPGEYGITKMYRKSPLQELAIYRPELIVNLSASPFSASQENRRKEILARKASTSGLPLVYVNQVGAQAEVIYDGGSLFMGPGGELLHELSYFGEDFRIIDTGERGKPQLQPPASGTEKIHSALILGIRDYFLKTGFGDAILGLSGGIDSAVVAALATEALGAAHVRGLLLPSRYSSSHSVDDARAVARNLGIRHELLNIEPATAAFSAILAPLFSGLPEDVTEENIQARTRAVLLMAVSNKTGAVLLNTSNKSETAVGYGTLYGDMCGGLAVLGDVYKTEVYRLARLINSEREIIPLNSIRKPPSAELRPGQKDSDSLPEYPLLDQILFQYIEMNMPPAEISAEGAERTLVDSIIRMVNRNEFKRFQAPPVLRISTKSFGSGRRMPLAAKF